MQDHLGEHGHTALASVGRRRNHWGCGSAHDCRSGIEKMKSLSCVVVRRWTISVSWLNCLHECVSNGGWLGNKPHLDYIALSSPFDCIRLVDFEGCWVHDCDFKMQTRTNHRLLKTFVGRKNGEVFTLLPCDSPKMYVPIPYWKIGWERSHLLLEPSPPVLHTTFVCSYAV